MPKPKPGSISINLLAMLGIQSYSRPPELIPRMCLEIVRFYSKRGRTTIEAVEQVAEAYVKSNPQSAACISIFLTSTREIME